MFVELSPDVVAPMKTVFLGLRIRRPYASPVELKNLTLETRKTSH